MGTTREIQFPKRFYVSKQIKLNKTQVRSMIKNGRLPQNKISK